jgi:quercetin dioxygenase-like cupin family protein
MSERLELPDGTAYEVIHTPTDPATDISEMVFTLRPGGPAPPPHIHPGQTETFTLEDGDFELLVDGKWRQLGVGESLTVPVGDIHTFRNKGERTARVRMVHDPALTFEDFLRDMHATAVEHNAESIGPAMAVRMAVLFRRYPETIQPGPLPLKIAFGLMGRLGPLVGLKPAGHA